MLAPCDVAADGFRLRLGKDAVDGQIGFGAHIQRVDVLFLKGDADIQRGQQADIVEAVHDVAGKPGHRLDKNPVDFALFALANHLHEFRPFLRAGAGQSLVGKDADELPLRVLLDFLCVIGLLGFVAVFLFFLLGGNPAVGRYAKLAVFRTVLGLQFRKRRDDRDLLRRHCLLHHPG